jgi:hypothetical protein
MNVRQTLTGLVFLRRISRALQEQNKLLTRMNELKELELSLGHPAAYKSHKGNMGRTPRVVEISVASVEAWDKAWAESHPQLDAED